MATQAGIAQIRSDEGVFKSARKDSLGVLTIGRGFNLTRKDANKFLEKAGVPKEDIEDVKKERGKALSDEQVESLFNLSVKEASERAEKIVPNLKELPSEVRDVVVNMSFQLGNKLKDFKKLRKSLSDRDFKGASKEILSSLLAKQTPERAKRLASKLSKAGEPKTAIGQKQALRSQYERDLFDSNADKISRSLSRESMINKLSSSIGKLNKEASQKVADTKGVKEDG